MKGEGREQLHLKASERESQREKHPSHDQIMFLSLSLFDYMCLTECERERVIERQKGSQRAEQQSVRERERNPNDILP